MAKKPHLRALCEQIKNKLTWMTSDHPDYARYRRIRDTTCPKPRRKKRK